MTLAQFQESLANVSSLLRLQHKESLPLVRFALTLAGGLQIESFELHASELYPVNLLYFWYCWEAEQGGLASIDD